MTPPVSHRRHFAWWLVAILLVLPGVARRASGQALDPDFPPEQQLAGAIDSGSLVAVRRMLDAGADPNTPYDGATPLVRAIVRSKSYVVQLLCQYGATVDARDDDGWTPLFWAIARGETKIAGLLIEHGANIRSLETRHLQSPLHVAAAHGHTPLVVLLMKQGAPLELRDRFGETALSEAAFGGHAQVVDLMVKQGLAVEWPLHVAAGLGDRQRALELIRGGADINAPTRGWQNTPLAYAVGGGQLEMAKWLVEQGAAIDSRNVAGATPLHIAAGHERTEIARWLVERDNSLTRALDNEGLTPREWSRNETIRQLLAPTTAAADPRGSQRNTARSSGDSGG
jgi:ankyrin repeat protein